MELLVEKQNMPVVAVPLREHVEVQESPLPEQIVRLPNEIHEQHERRRVLNLVIVVDHQLGVKSLEVSTP